MKNAADYQTLNEELNAVLEKLQSEDLDVDTAVASYERGMELIIALESQLKDAENKIAKVKQQWDSAK